MPSRRNICYVFVVLLCRLQLISADDTLCGNNEEMGIDENKLNDFDTEDPDTGTTNKAYLHMGTGGKITCCGILDRYRFETDISGDIYFMIWRPTAGTYELISYLYKNCGANRCDIDATNNDRITVKSTDYYGWYTPGAEIIQYATGAGFNLVSTTALTPVLGMTYDWSQTGLTLVNNRIHGINIRLDRNSEPVFSAPGNPTSITITEAYNIGDLVYSAVSASDIDASDNESLNITMAENNYFVYTSTSTTAGVVTVKNSINSGISPVTLTFTVEDQCHNADTATLTINIDNVLPVLPGLPIDVSISEHTESIIPLTIINVTDYNDSISCSVDSVSSSNAFTSTGSFTLTKMSDAQFNLTTSSVAAFRYLLASSHDVTIRCFDGDGYGTGVVKVNIIRNIPPNITNLPSSFLLNEDTNTETRLLVLNYTDSDQPTSATTISLGAGSTPSDFADKFKIRQVNGTNNWAIFSKSGASFNASASDTYTLLIEANDTVDVTTETFTVYIKANTPPEINNLNASVSMHVDSPIGFVIFKVNAIDLENDSVTYSFNCTPTCDYFTFLSDGSVVLNQNIMNLTTTGFNFSVTPHDAKRSGATKLLAVHVAGINNLPIMVGLNSNVSIPEGTAIGSYIAEATCNDIDVPNTDTLKYFISCEPTWGSHFVTINDSDGVIRTLSTINYESIPVASGARTITCIATCFDGLASSSATLVANILDINEPPAFAQSSYTFNVNEGPANTTYFTSALTVTDDDPGDTVTLAHDCGAYTGLFRINSTDGRMSFGADVDVDTTAPQSITCLINATDSTGLFATATVTLIIANVNDNIPMIRSPVYSFTVLKQATVGSPVGTITATDGDIAPWGEISYTLDQTGTGCACFDVTSSGQLIVGQSLTGLNTSYVSFNVTVTDLGGNADTAKITVYLLEVATTTPLDRYLTFIDDTGNIAWLIPAVVIFAVAAGVIGFLVFTAKSTAHASTLKCQCCRLRRSFSPKRSKRPRQSRSRSPVAHTQYRHFPQIKPV